MKHTEQQLIDLLSECKLQLEYLNEKFPSTGTTNALIARLGAAMENTGPTDNGDKPDSYAEWLVNAEREAGIQAKIFKDAGSEHSADCSGAMAFAYRYALEQYSKATSAKECVSGALPPTEDEVLHYFYHIGAADALAKAISRNGGKPDFERRLKEFGEFQGGNDR